MATKYCSIDLEFTGFDPEKEQILEIGFAFFEVGENGFTVTEQWSQVFKPTVEVHPKILGLTGISQAEIDVAPNIAQFRDFLSDKLHDAILMAHNPILDIRFLELAGVKLSGQSIDTLELVQFLLPTHHSYNLENLMHYFGIEHKDSHRALADCLSTISLLEKMIAIHSRFTPELKAKLAAVLAKTDFLWAKLLELNFDVDSVQVNDSLAHGEFADDELPDFALPITIDPKHHLHESRVVNTLTKQDGEWLVVMRSKQEVLRLWQAGVVEGTFQSKDLFDKNAFEQFMKSASTSEELRFILKILVWMETNWQTKTILDLNLSFFGGQFKSFITGGNYKAGSKKILACDYEALTFLSENNLETTRQLIVCDLQRFESHLTGGSKERLSWYYFSFILKSIYNPETEYGLVELKDEVVDALSSVDLFFGLVQLILRKNLKQLDYISINELESLYGLFYNRLHQAAQNLSVKLKALGSRATNDSVTRLGDNLENFFKIEQNYIKWVELTDENVILHSQPIEIKSIASELVGKFASVGYTDTLLQAPLLFYFAERLGLDTEVLLFHNKFVKLNLTELTLNHSNPLDDLMALSEAATPIVLIFATSSAVKTFYKDHFDNLGSNFRVFAQEYSGSGNKIFRNFKIFPNALLLATSQFINKQKYNAVSGSLGYIDWPDIDSRHPYVQALLQTYSSAFPNLKDTLTFSEFICNLKQLSGHQLPKLALSASAKVQAEKNLKQS